LPGILADRFTLIPVVKNAGKEKLLFQQELFNYNWFFVTTTIHLSLKKYLFSTNKTTAVYPCKGTLSIERFL
jgi:hypothetical protein